MRKTEKEELQKHTLLLYAGDYAKLQEHYPTLGAAVVIRRLVRKTLNNIDKSAPQTEEIEL